MSTFNLSVVVLLAIGAIGRTIGAEADKVVLPQLPKWLADQEFAEKLNLSDTQHKSILDIQETFAGSLVKLKINPGKGNRSRYMRAVLETMRQYDVALIRVLTETQLDRVEDYKLKVALRDRLTPLVEFKRFKRDLDLSAGQLQELSTLESRWIESSFLVLGQIENDLDKKGFNGVFFRQYVELKRQFEPEVARFESYVLDDAQFSRLEMLRLWQRLNTYGPKVFLEARTVSHLGISKEQRSAISVLVRQYASDLAMAPGERHSIHRRTLSALQEILTPQQWMNCCELGAWTTKNQSQETHDAPCK